MLAVTGATGQLGGRVAARLAKLGLKQRLIVRDPSRAPKLPGAEVVNVSSFGDVIGMGRALAGIDTLFLVSAHDRFTFAQRAAQRNLPLVDYSRVQQHTGAVDAAAAVGVKRIVYLSFLNAAADSTFVLARDHFHTEEHIHQIGMPFTFVRMSLYMDDIPLHVSMDGVIRAPAGEGHAAWVSRDDLADVIVAVMNQSGHEGRSYDVTGPEAITMVESAERLSAATGRKISYQMLTPHEARVSRKMSGFDMYEAERRKLSGDIPTEHEVEIWVTHYMQIATGELATVSDTVPKLTRHKALSLAEYLRKYPESYKHLLVSR